jgi:hypothetical protein
MALRYRRALVRTAVRAAAAGLPVVPGAWWDAQSRRFDCDQTGCARSGPHPAVDSDGRFGTGLAAHALRHPDAVIRRWRYAPYAVLVPTGEACDVVDVPADIGHKLALRLDARSILGPVIAAGSRWFFLTAPGGRLPALGGDALVHGQGSWVMLPPSQGPGGDVATWLARPNRAGSWPLPRRDDVIRCLEICTIARGRPDGSLLAAV